MSDSEKLDLLKAWEAQVLQYEELTKMMEPLFGCVADMPLHEKITDLLLAYTDSISTLVGDTSTWLRWFHWENDMGKRGLEVSFKGGNTLSVKSIEDLLTILVMSERDDTRD